jgi:hypothetical protein
VNAVFGLCGVPCFVAMPALIRAVGGDSSWLGLTFAAGGIGSLLAGVVVPILPTRRIDLVRIACFALVGCNVPYVLMALTRAPWQVAMAAGVMGFFCSIGAAVGDGLVQARIPRSWQGRFNAGSTVISRMLMPIGLLGGGAIADAVGPHMVYTIGGTVCVLLSMLLIMNAKYRRFLRGSA